jgi:hypothetical protein
MFLVTGFVNNADVPLNVTGIVATLNDPAQFYRVVHNITFKRIAHDVPAGDELTLELPWSLPKASSFALPKSLTLVARVMYHDHAEPRAMHYSSLLLNETLVFTDAPEPLAWAPPLSSILSAVVAAVAIAYALEAAPSWKAAFATAAPAAAAPAAPARSDLANVSEEMPSIKVIPRKGGASYKDAALKGAARAL